MPARKLLPLLALFAACAASNQPLPTSTLDCLLQTPPAGGAPEASLRYNSVQQKSSHNSYDKRASLREQLEAHGLRSLELDIHTRRLGWLSIQGDWFVYHYNFFSGLGTNCFTLRSCLEELEAFHEANPAHSVITVWVDFKDEFDAYGHRPEDLDRLITDVIPPEQIETPQKLLARCPGASSLREAVTGGCSWPSLEELRGKFIFATTGSGAEGPEELLSQYTDGGRAASERVAFIAPNTEREEQIGGLDYVVFYNMNKAETALASEILAANFVSRVWVAEDPGEWAEAINACTHHIATDDLDEAASPWATTKNDLGWPFRCFDSLQAGIDCDQISE